MSWSSIFARHVVLPLHEALLRRATMAYARELADSQWLAPAELRTHQSARLARLLQHASKNVPFYRARLLPELGSGDEDPFVQLQRLPLLSKDNIRGAGESIVWRDAPGGLARRSTGGSTGQPLTFFLDRRRQAYDQAARMRSHRWYGVKFGECEVLLWGSPVEKNRTDAIRTVRDRLLNQHLLDAFQMSTAQMDRYITIWNRLQPVALFGYPSSIALFARHVTSQNRALNLSRLRAVFVTGEVCQPHDRQDIEDFFQVPVADGYGSREAGFIAHQCRHGSMHITAENVIVEIIRDGAAVSTGESGEIVVTHLDAYAMPFIRYRTGDIGRLLPGRCRCGRGLPLMDVVQGRSTDFLVLPDGTIKHALSIIYPLRDMEGIQQFRVVQQADFGVTVELVPQRRGETICVKTVERRIRPVVGDGVAVGVRFVESIEPAPSGKHRYVVSHARPNLQGATA